MKPTVVIAGATGFLGRWFMHTFRDRYHFIALTRKSLPLWPEQGGAGVEWRQAELYSLSEAERAVEGADFALYLVHSMRPSTRLNQGSFRDTDILLADNFARAAAAKKLQQIVFLSGLQPDGGQPSGRGHLQSRHEVEQTLAQYSTPLTVLRAGLILGPGGTTFLTLKRLVERLPVMACPQWASSLQEPVGWRDVLSYLHHVLGNADAYGSTFDIRGPGRTTYLDMLRLLSKKMGRRRWVFSVPAGMPGFSRLWIAWFAGLNRDLALPLVESLEKDLLGQPNWLQRQWPPKQTVSMAMDEALRLEGEVPPLPVFREGENERNTVRSVQRLPNPGGWTAAWVARRYQTWLPVLFRYLIRVEQRGDTSVFRIGPFELLHLQLIGGRSHAGRQLFYIVGGQLVKRRDYGWLEFRTVLSGRYTMAAIHEFVPTLPWYVYMSTQAIAHLWVMHRFSKYLGRLGKEKEAGA